MWRSHTSKTKHRTFVKKSHTRRNISILATLVVMVIMVVALSGALSPRPTYVMIVHVYDNHYNPQTVYNVTLSMLIENVTVTVAGVDQPTRLTPTGIIAYDQLPAGTYQITVSGNGTVTTPIPYALGPDCADRTPDGQCHALIPATGPLFPANLAPLPAYLDRCVEGALVYHAHISLSLNISGAGFTIPGNVGIQSSCFKPLHTHDTTGTIHIETDQTQDYTLHDFFLIWANWENNPQRAIFNSTQLFGNHAGNGHSITMTVNGSPEPLLQNYVIPRNAQTSSDPCSLSPCQTIQIAITYT